VDDLPELILIIAVFELVVDVLQVGDIQLSLALDVQQGEVRLSSFLSEWTALSKLRSYDSDCEFLEESFEV
jgi:hypothetical protein